MSTNVGTQSPGTRNIPFTTCPGFEMCPPATDDPAERACPPSPVGQPPLPSFERCDAAVRVGDDLGRRLFGGGRRPMVLFRAPGPWSSSPCSGRSRCLSSILLSLPAFVDAPVSLCPPWASTHPWPSICPANTGRECACAPGFVPDEEGPCCLPSGFRCGPKEVEDVGRKISSSATRFSSAQPSSGNPRPCRSGSPPVPSDDVHCEAQSGGRRSGQNRVSWDPHRPGTWAQALETPAVFLGRARGAMLFTKPGPSLLGRGSLPPAIAVPGGTGNPKNS